MSARTIRRHGLVALALALLVGLGLYAVPAAVADQMATKVGLHFNGDGDHAGQQIEAIASVRALDGSSAYPTGSVTFSLGDGTPVALHPQYLNARLPFTIPSNDPFEVTATFHGTNGWGDSTITVIYTPLHKAFWDTSHPTVARIGTSPKITLSFGVYRRNSLGAPLAGRQVAFTLLAPVPNAVSPNRTSIPVCTATTNAQGFATCSGNVLLAVVGSLLTGGAFATELTGPNALLDSVRIPALKLG